MEPAQLLLTIIAISVFCLGFKTITEEGYILGFVGKFSNYLADKSAVLEYIFKPIIFCPPCMASFWGVLVFFSLNGITLELLPEMAIACISASFINALGWRLYDK